MAKNKGSAPKALHEYAGASSGGIQVAHDALKDIYNFQDENGDVIESQSREALNSIDGVVEKVLSKHGLDVDSKIFDHDKHEDVVKDIQIEIGSAIIKKYHPGIDLSKFLKKGDVEHNYEAINRLLQNVIASDQRASDRIRQQGAMPYFDLLGEIKQSYRGAVRDKVKWRALANKIYASKASHTQLLQNTIISRNVQRHLSKVTHDWDLAAAVHKAGVDMGVFDGKVDEAKLYSMNSGDAIKLYSGVRQGNVTTDDVSEFGLKLAKSKPGKDASHANPYVAKK